jgi:hypothetical protein
LTVAEIARFLGKHRSTVSRVINGHQDNSLLAAQVKGLWKLDRNYLKPLYMDYLFVKICDECIAKTKMNKVEAEIRKYAVSLKRTAKAMMVQDGQEIDTDDLDNADTLLDLLGLNNFNLEQQFLHERFYDVCEVVIIKSKDRDLREYAARLQKASENLRRGIQL